MSTDKETLNQAITHLGKDDLHFIKAVFDTYIINHNDPATNQDGNNRSSAFSDPYFWRQNSDKSINEYNSIPDNKDRQRERFIEKYPEENYQAPTDSERYSIELQKVMSYIRNDPDSSANIKKLCETQKADLEKEKLLGRAVSENEAGKAIVMIGGKKYRLREGEKYRPEYAMDTVEELYIRAVATSILAETDNESAGAKEILDNGGMTVVKNLDKRSAGDLLVDLQILALEGDTELPVSKDVGKNFQDDAIDKKSQGNVKSDEENLGR